MQKILEEPSQWGSARIVSGMRGSTAHWLGGSARIVSGPADRPDHLIISQESAAPPREMSRTNRPYLSQMADNLKNKGALLSQIFNVGENKVSSGKCQTNTARKKENIISIVFPTIYNLQSPFAIHQTTNQQVFTPL